MAGNWGELIEQIYLHGGEYPPDSRGINWWWALHFPSSVEAQGFVDWLEDNGYEHRGVYPPRSDDDDRDEGYAVRFR